MFKQFDITVDTLKDVKNTSFKVNTNDLNTLKLVINIVQGGVPLDLTGTTVRLTVKKPDNTTVFQDCTITDAINGKVEIVLSSQAYVIQGKYEAEVYIYSGVDAVSVTSYFNYEAKKGVLDNGSVQSSNDWPALNQALLLSDEVVTARKTSPNLGNRLDGIDTQLASKANQSSLTDGLSLKVDKVTGKGLSTNDYTTAEKAEVAKVSLKADKTYVDTELNDIAVTQINKNLGKFDQTYMADTFLQQMAGTTPINAVPADYSITTNKLAFSTILGVKSKNLFNKNSVTNGKYLDIATGLPIDNASYFVSDFIKVSPNTNYYLKSNVNARTAFYDANKAYISNSLTSSVSFTTTATVEYVRITSVLTSIDSTQLELGTAYTGYESFNVKVDNSVFLPNSLNGEAFSKKTLALEKIAGFERGKNLFNKLLVLAGQSLNGNTGIPSTNVDYYTSDFISVDPSTQYAIAPTNAFTKVCYYNSTKGFISVEVDGATTFTTPSNAMYIRFSNYNASLNSTQVELGSAATTYEDYIEDLATLKIDERIAAIASIQKPIYKFNDAWVAWKNGEKFPMSFFGDSTVDGMGTTGFAGNGLGTDGNSPNSFSVKLQTLLRSITGNSTLRIYNAGFSGMKADWGLTNIAAEFSGTAAYSDVKMVGIGFGINDRLSYQTDKAYRTGFKTNIKAMIDWFYAHNIQPFLVTTQALNSPDTETQYISSFPLRTAMDIETIANEVKRELAEEYNLEIVDINKFTEDFLLYSSYPAKTIIPDRVHFGDIGHNYEAGMLFSCITPISIYADGYTKIDYSSQKLQTGVPEELITVPDVPSDSFKLYANYTKADSLDTKIMDVYVFNSGRKQLSLKAYKNSLVSSTYVKVNGVTTTLSNLETILSSIDLGLYRLEVYTGLSDKVDFKGFIVE